MRYYTGIGSRETPEEILEVMKDFGYRLARAGYKLRSGKAPGSDSAFQLGMQKYAQECGDSLRRYLGEIYIPWKAFKGGEGLLNDWDIPLDAIDKEFPEHADMRWSWVKEVHGGWDKLSQGARKLHERNIHQVFGKNLGDAYTNQSKFVVYYAQETKSGAPKGGTATAVNMAKKQGIRTINLLKPKNLEVFEGFLKSVEDIRGIKN